MAPETNGHTKQGATALKILAAAQKQSERTHIALWGIDIEIRGMTMGARSQLLTEGYTQGTDGQPIYRIFYPMLLRATCFDPTDGTAIFEGVSNEELNELPSAEVERICKIALGLSGLDKEAQKKLGGDSGGTMTSTSGTDSRVTSVAP